MDCLLAVTQHDATFNYWSGHQGPNVSQAHATASAGSMKIRRLASPRSTNV